MIGQIESLVLQGTTPRSVRCEAALSNQLPSFALVGLPGSVTQESRERVRIAIESSGLEWPARKVTVNLWPAELPKWGSHLELPMALAVLAAQAKLVHRNRVVALGELALTGEIRPSRWLAMSPSPAASSAFWIVHPEDARDLIARGENEARIFPASSLSEALACLLRVQEDALLEADEVSGPTEAKPAEHDRFSGFRQIRAEPWGLAASLLAVAGRHHVFFGGPAGMGKSTLARAIAEALPPLAEAERRERRAIAESLGVFSREECERGGRAGELVARRPVVWLHSGVSRAGLEGAVLASGQVIAGELSRAHLGAVVLDEFLEMRRDALECLRQPIEEHVVRLQRARVRALLPARVQVLATSNLCPCGLWGGERSGCVCPGPVLRHYQRKLSGPLLDRFDLLILVNGQSPVRADPELQSMVERLADVSSWQERLERAEGNRDRKVPIGAEHDLSRGVGELAPALLSQRALLKVARVSRTIALLLGEKTAPRHLRLALRFRQISSTCRSISADQAMVGETQPVSFLRDNVGIGGI